MPKKGQRRHSMEVIPPGPFDLVHQDAHIKLYRVGGQPLDVDVKQNLATEMARIVAQDPDFAKRARPAVDSMFAEYSTYELAFESITLAEEDPGSLALYIGTNHDAHELVLIGDRLPLVTLVEAKNSVSDPYYFTKQRGVLGVYAPGTLPNQVDVLHSGITAIANQAPDHAHMLEYNVPQMPHALAEACFKANMQVQHHGALVLRLHPDDEAAQIPDDSMAWYGIASNGST
jgi:hypothetical protein